MTEPPPRVGDVAHLPAWLRRTAGEPRWPVGLAVLVLVALQLRLPGELTFKPHWLLPAIELVLFAVLMVVNPSRINRESTVVRGLGLAVVTVASVSTAWSAERLVDQLLHRMAGIDAASLLINGGTIWLTNVLVFALWLWELDRGGPAARANARRTYPDLLFAQMTAPELTHPDWEPAFLDYLYLAFTNATAFSPTDTLPLTQRAKLAMMLQSAVSLVIVLLVVARAVNILAN